MNTDPVETVTAAIVHELGLLPHEAESQHVEAAQGALASLARHRDDIARVAYEWWDGAEPWADVPEDSREQFRGMADAVLAYLGSAT